MLLQKLPQLTGPGTWSIIRISGRSRAAGASPLTAVYAGNGANFSYLRGLMFGESDTQELARPSSAWALMSELMRCGSTADVVLAELPPLWAALIRLPGRIHIPAWVRHELDISSAPAGKWLLSRHVEREADRQIRKHQYCLRLSETEADFRTFFHELYRPYVQSRFGDGAHVMAEHTFLDRCHGHTLALLESEHQPVAAVLLKRNGNALRFGWYGCANSPPPQGASEALDVLCIRHAHRQGVRRIVFGDSRPSLADGVTRYKSRFGATIGATTFPQAKLAIDVHNWTRELAECINDQRLVAIRRGQPRVISIDMGVAPAQVLHGPV